MSGMLVIGNVNRHSFSHTVSRTFFTSVIASKGMRTNELCCGHTDCVSLTHCGANKLHEHRA